MRLSYTKNGSGTEIIEENNYYPFGLKHQGYNQTLGNPAYKYQYNGKELQQETGWSDFGARMYMADIGRWGVIDPLAETSTRFTPYNYAYNNPISFIDPDGRKAIAPSGTEPIQPMDGAWGYALGGGAATFGSFQEFLDQQNPMASFMKNYKGGGGSRIFGETKAYRDLMAAYYRGGTGGLINKNGWLRWWTDLGQEDKGNLGTFNIMKLLNDGIAEISNKADGISYDLMHYQTENFFKDLEKHLNGGLGIASAAVAGQSRLPDGIKYLNKIKGLSRFSKVLGRAGVVGTALTVGVTFSEYYNDEWTAHTVINTALLAGTLAATVFGAPAVLTGIAIYGIADYAFGIGDKLDSEFGRGSIFWNTHIAN